MVEEGVEGVEKVEEGALHRKLDYVSNYLKRVLGKKVDVTCGRGLSEASAGAARGGGGPGREGSKP